MSEMTSDYPIFRGGRIPDSYPSMTGLGGALSRVVLRTIFLFPANLRMHSY